MSVGEHTHLLSVVDDEAEADEVLELRMLLRKPALQPQQVQLKVTLVGVVSRLIVVIACSPSKFCPKLCWKSLGRTPK